jgi:hypothetical protein
MARSSRTSIPWAGVAVGGAIAALALPRLLKASRRAALKIGGRTYTSGTPGSGRATADPSRGRPA